MDSEQYIAGWMLTAVLLFFPIWIYAISQWGFLIGFCLGWIPAAIGAAIIALAWPVIWFAVVAIILFVGWAILAG